MEEYTLLGNFGIMTLMWIGVRVLYLTVRMVYDHYLAQCRPMTLTKMKLLGMGKWAVVTGATEGVGKAYVIKLAKFGLDIVMISDDECKLREMAVWIRAKYHVEIRTIVANFINTSLGAYHLIEIQLRGLQVGVLINNVGVSYPHPEYFLDMSHQLCSKIINNNIYSVTKMCCMLMPQMVERGKGVIVNVSSATADVPSPLLTIFAATQAYIKNFSLNLDYEYKGQGVIIQCLLPGFITTRRSLAKDATFFVPSAEKYVDRAVKLIGVQTICTGYLPHSFLVNVIHFSETLSPGLTLMFICWFMNISEPTLG